MSIVKLELKGLAEFRDALRNLPEALTDEAATIVQAHAEQAADQIRGAYPEGPTGNLRRGVTKDHYRGRFTAHAIVRSRARHAQLFERGTKPRRTARGLNRGTMPQAPENQRMIPIVIRRRRAMVEALKNLLERAGFQVSDV